MVYISRLLILECVLCKQSHFKHDAKRLSFNLISAVAYLGHDIGSKHI